MEHSIFVSYSRRDKEFVQELVDSLRENGLKVWFDVHLLSGQDWDDALEEQIKSCNHMIIVLSKTSVASDNVKNEMRYAMDLGKRIHPILIEACSVPLSMRRMHYIDFLNMGYDNGVKRLVDDIKHEVGKTVIQEPQLKAVKKSKIKPLLLGLLGLVIISLAVWQFWPKKISNPNDKVIIKTNAVNWLKISDSKDVYDYTQYMLDHQNTEGKLNDATNAIHDLLTDEGAMFLNRSTFEKLFFKLVYRDEIDSSVVNVTRNFDLPFPKAGDVLIAQKQISVIDPKTVDNMGGVFLMPGDVVQYDELLDASGEQMFIKFRFKKDTHAKMDQTPSERDNSPKMTVIGFHPHWSGDTFSNYNYELLSAIAYFSYELDPVTGSYKTLHDWDTTPIVNKAHDAGAEVYLTVTCFGSDNKRFLSNAKAMETSVNLIYETVRSRNADGVVIDFQDIPSEMSDNFTGYIKKLSGALKEQNSKLSLHIQIPLVDYNAVFNIMALDAYVDYFIVNGFNDVEKLKKAAPIAPLLRNPDYEYSNLETSVNYYLNKNLPVSKMILNVPYFGAQWEINERDGTETYINTLTYKSIRNKYPESLAVYDPISHSMSIKAKTDDPDIYTQIWFDNAQTLSEKYEFVIENKLAGIGIWALGYDNGYNELREVLDEKFDK